MKLLKLLLVVLLLACSGNNKEVIEVNESKEAIICGLSLISNYNLSIGTWEKDTLRYKISSHLIDDLEVRRVADIYSFHMNIPILESNDNFDIEILTDNIDGEGNSMGTSFRPPISEFSIYPVPITLDEVDIVHSKLNSFSIILHEFGHAIGLRHSNIKGSIMGEKYKDQCFLHLDDIIAIRTKYKNHSSFEYDGDTFVFVSQFDDSYISKNFLAAEYTSSCQTGSFISMDLVNKVQRLRDLYGPIRISSSFRDEDCNRSVGGSTQSSHQLSQGVDLVFLRDGALRKFKMDIRDKAPIYYELISTIHGIGLYDRHVHLDNMNREKISIWTGISRLYKDF